MIDQVRPAGLAAWMNSHATGVGNAVVLDVRQPAELAVASVKPDGFELVAIPMSEIAQRLSELDPDRPVACLCHTGMRSQRVAMFLAANGFTQVANVAGGIDAWSRELDPGVPLY